MKKWIKKLKRINRNSLTGFGKTFSFSGGLISTLPASGSNPKKITRMKKFIPFFSIAFLLAACSSQPQTETKSLQAANQAVAPVDTAGLAQFQQWKTQNELSVAANPQTEQQPAAVQPQVQTRTIVREVVVEKAAPVRRQTTRPSSTAPETTTPPVTPTETSTSTSTGSGSESSAGSGTETTGTTGAPAPAPETAKKEGWSKAAKGAAIGGAGGAVIGAVISKKNPAVGAAIGGVLGGAVGYGVGRSKDKKDGRY